MMVNTVSTEKPKRVSRTKKTETAAVVSETATDLPKTYKPLVGVSDSLSDLITKTEQAKQEITELQNKILESQKAWQEEQREHEKQVLLRDEELRLARRREEEEYQYRKEMERRRAEVKVIEGRAPKTIATSEA